VLLQKKKNYDSRLIPENSLFNFLNIQQFNSQVDSGIDNPVSFKYLKYQVIIFSFFSIYLNEAHKNTNIKKLILI